MNRRRFVLALGTVALAGCTAQVPSEPSETTTAPDPSVAYENLSDEGQRLFDRLLDETAIEVPGSAVPETLAAADAVTFRATTYPLSVTQLDRMVAQYTIIVEPVFEDVGVQTVTPFSALSPTAQTAFQRAREGPSGYSYPIGEQVPAGLTDPEYIRYDGEPFDVTTVVADIPVLRLEITRPTA